MYMQTCTHASQFNSLFFCVGRVLIILIVTIAGSKQTKKTVSLTPITSTL